MAKKSRTAPTKNDPAQTLDPDAATIRPGTLPAEDATVFDVPVARDADDATQMLSVLPTAKGGDDDATAMLDMAALQAAATKAQDSVDGPTLRLPEAEPPAKPSIKIERHSVQVGSEVRHGGRTPPDVFTPRSDEVPVAGPLGVDVAMRWGDEILTAAFYPRPATVTIGMDGAFALPPDVMGGKAVATLIEPRGATDFNLRLDMPGVTGTVWQDGQAQDVASLGGKPVAIGAKTRATLHFGDFTFELARAAVPPPPGKGKFKKENLLLLLCFSLALVFLVGPLVASLIAAPARDKTKLSLEEQIKEREAELIEVKPVEEPKEPEEAKVEEKKIETPVQAPPQQKEQQQVKAEEKKIDELKDLKGEERDEKKAAIVAEAMKRETAVLDDALKGMPTIPTTRLFADAGEGGVAPGDPQMVADPTGELSKELGGQGGGGNKPGAIDGGGDATQKKIAGGLEKDTKIGDKKVDIEGKAQGQKVVKVGSAGGESSGELPKEVIKKYIASKMGAIKACYQKGLQSNPDLTGKVKVAFLIQPTGAVFGAKIEDSSLANTAVEDCILNNVRNWHFPPAQGGGTTVVKYPFAFTSTH